MIRWQTGLVFMALDVQYEDNHAVAAAVLFDDWQSDRPLATELSVFPDPAPYVPGHFVERELPPLLQVIKAVDASPEAIIIDGYVFLDGTTEPGLGKHLFDALDGTVPIIGVAKNRFKGLPDGFDIFRASSTRPLFVTTVATDLEEAKAGVISMHGGNRIPTMLKRVHQLARKASSSQD